MINNIVKAVLLLVIVLSVHCIKKDQIDPNVYIIYPTENSAVSGVVRIKAVAMDNIEVCYVEFFVNNVRKGIDSTASNSVYEYVWNTTSEWYGTKMITAKAYDDAGNVSESPSVSVRIESLTPSGPTYHSGEIAFNQTWTKQLSPHIIEGELQVSALLTIEAGAVVKFSAVDSYPHASEIRVNDNGDIVARGTDNQPILFTSNESIPNPGDWWRIFLEASDFENTYFDNCIIEYALYGIDFEGRVISVTNTLIQYCSENGIVCDYGRFKYFQNNTITKNYNFPILISANAVSSLGPNNDFLGNYYLEYGDVIEINEGEIFQGGTWQNHGVPYYISDDIELYYDNDPPPVLTIESGCILAFENSTFYCNEGTKLVADNVTFTSINALINEAQPGEWQSIVADHSSLELNNCIIEYGGEDDAAIIYSGQSDYQVLLIDNCVIRYNEQSGILLDIQEMGMGDLCIANTRINNNNEYPVFLYNAEYIRTLGPGNNFIGNGNDIILVSDDGEVTTSGIWYNCRVPYFIEGDIEIVPGWQNNPPTITIMPGVIMKFDDCYLKVDEGTLIADGSAGTIIFTADNDYGSGRWDGIIFNNETNDDLTRLNNCIIQYGGQSSNTQRANIYCNNSAPRITNCEICHSFGWGVALHNSVLDPDTLLRYNRFYDNDSGAITIIIPENTNNMNTITRIEKESEHIKYNTNINNKKNIREHIRQTRHDRKTSSRNRQIQDSRLINNHSPTRTEN